MERIGGVRVIIKLDDESLLTNVGRDALQLQGLENDPIEKFLVSGSKLPQVLDHVLVVISANRLLGSRELGSGMLADRFV